MMKFEMQKSGIWKKISDGTIWSRDALSFTEVDVIIV